MIEFYVLASGSKGNSTIIKIDDNTSILIDSGLSYEDFLRRLDNTNVKVDTIKYVFITHNHIDHVKSIFKWNNAIIYSLEGTIPGLNYNILEPFKLYNFGSFSVTPFKVSHDAPNPCGYQFILNNETLVYMTDTGDIPQDSIKYLSNQTYYIIESNHDSRMLLSSKRPEDLKLRILSDHGHLSNDMTSAYLSILIGENTKEIVFAHISEECNCDDSILKSYKKFVGKTKYYDNIQIKLARQNEVVKG
jgi:phosphoribosyl 1,2-cyclic phosphodiesterase